MSKVFNIVGGGGGGANLKLSKIEIKHAPDKTNYIPGEIFDPAGMVVEAVYSLKDVEIARSEVTGYTFQTTGLQETQTSVTITYQEGAIHVSANQAVHVERAVISAIPTQTGSLTYTGSAQTPTWNYDFSGKLTISGDVSATDAGTYHPNFTPTYQYKWSDGSTGPKAGTWTMGPKAITIPSTDETVFPFNGSPQGPIVTGVDASAVTQTGTSSATDVGDYTINFALKSKTNYKWTDNTTTDKQINWSIGTKEVTIPTAATTEFTYNGGAQGPVVTGVEASAVTVSGTESATEAGNYTITYTLKNTASFEWSDHTTAPKTISWKIKRKQLTKPTITPTAYTYDGTAKSPTVNGFDGSTMTQTGTGTATNAAANAAAAVTVNTLTFALKDTKNYEWADGSVANVARTWQINRAAGSLSVSPTSLTFNTSTLNGNFTVTRSGDGAITVSSSDTSVATVALQSGTTYKVSSVNNKSGTATITVKVAQSQNYTAPSDKTVSISAEFMPPQGNPLEQYTWEQIRQISDAGLGSTYFKVADRKSVVLNGSVGVKTYSNLTLYVRILGFDHNSAVEGANKIHFGGFHTAATGGVDVALDTNYGEYKTDGTKMFNMNHWGNQNYGGWAACDMRYDILGSTNVAPDNYGKIRTTSDKGYDATATCATSPVANTLMAALPSALRAVLKPITKYQDNKGNKSNVEANVTATVDYLPMLAEFEVHGTRSYANQYEQNKQKQYDYYKNGNAKIKYQQNSTSSAMYWWNRSPRYNGASSFCNVNNGGGAGYSDAYDSYGVSCAFAV